MREKYTSVLVMLSEYFMQCSVVFTFLLLCCIGTAHGRIIDRVVASIDDLAITESELREKHQELLKVNKDITVAEALQNMINRNMLLKDAKKYRMEGEESEVIKQYIDLKIRALIVIQENEVRKYFNNHQEEFEGQKYETVYQDIVKYLTELQVNERLKLQIEKLRSGASIRIMLDDPK